MLVEIQQDGAVAAPTVGLGGGKKLDSEIFSEKEEESSSGWGAEYRVFSILQTILAKIQVCLRTRRC